MDKVLEKNQKRFLTLEFAIPLQWIYIMKKYFLVLVTAALLAGCSPDNSRTQVQETSAFTANIDKYWQEHDIDGVLAEQGFSEEALAPIRAEMLAMYGENKEIRGKYDKEHNDYVQREQAVHACGEQRELYKIDFKTAAAYKVYAELAGPAVVCL